MRAGCRLQRDPSMPVISIGQSLSLDDAQRTQEIFSGW
jgi:hypothetical protein